MIINLDLQKTERDMHIIVKHPAKGKIRRLLIHSGGRRDQRIDVRCRKDLSSSGRHRSVIPGLIPGVCGKIPAVISDTVAALIKRIDIELPDKKVKALQGDQRSRKLLSALIPFKGRLSLKIIQKMFLQLRGCDGIQEDRVHPLDLLIQPVCRTVTAFLDIPGSLAL